MGRIAQSVQRLTTDWTVRDRIQVGTRFSSRPNRPWGPPSGVPRNFVRGGFKNSVEDRGQRERGSGGGNRLVRGSGGTCNLVQEISFHNKLFLIFDTLRLFMMTTNLFVIANVKQLRT